ncbi:protein PF14_0175-like [Stegodyphus dumicola]|uniref:protein PF14_0175-like n=1 Tax=Stegodyphus dumicola TaxID=202533 RepID=UPI0015A76771|nr:protein PF14_0175-like [Stegodyphus dumicola]
MTIPSAKLAFRFSFLEDNGFTIVEHNGNFCLIGYLREVRCLNSWQIFLIESSDLQEYYRLCKEGKQYPTNVDGKSLLEILREYCFLRRGSSKQSGIQSYSNSTSDSFSLKNCGTDNKDFFNYQSVAQKSSGNISKVKTNKEVAKSLDGSNSLIYPLQVANDYENIIRRFLARAEADPVFDKYLSYICSNYKRNLTQESASTTVKNNSFKNNDDVREGDRGTEISPCDEKSKNLMIVNSFTSKNTDTVLEVNNVLKSILPKNDSFSNHDIPIHNSEALNDNKNINDLSQNLANSFVNSVDNSDDEDSVIELPITSIQKQEISKHINVSAEVSSAPCILTDKLNAQTIDSKNLSVDIQDSCNDMLIEHKPKSADLQSHSGELVTNIGTANAVCNESLQVLENCHSQQLEKNTKENNTSFQMCLTSNEHNINTEEIPQTTVSSDVNDVQRNWIGDSKFPADDTSDKMDTNNLFSKSEAPILTENIVPSQVNICDKLIHNNFTSAENQPNTFVDIRPLVPSVQTLNVGTSVQTVNNLLPTSTILQWPYSAVPTILTPGIGSNTFQNGYQYNLLLNAGLDLNSNSTGKIIFVNKIAPEDASLSMAAKSCTNESGNGIINYLNSRSPSTKTPENNKRKKEVKEESQCPPKRTSVDSKSPSSIKQLKTYSKVQKLSSVLSSGSCASPKKKYKNENKTKMSERTNASQKKKSTSFFNKKLSRNKRDIKFGCEILSEDIKIQSPALESSISSSKLLSSEQGCLSATQAQTINISPKTSKDKRDSQIKLQSQDSFGKDFPNRRTSLRIKKLRNISAESQNLDNDTTFMKDVPQKEKTTENINCNDNNSDTDQHMTNVMVSKTMKDACANKAVISEVGNEVLTAMNKVMQLKLSNCVDKILPDASKAVISTEIQSDILNDGSNSSDLPDFSESYNIKSSKRKYENESHSSKEYISAVNSFCPEQDNKNHGTETGELNLKITGIFSDNCDSKNAQIDEESIRCSNKESELAQAIAFITSEDFLADKSKFIRKSGKDLIVDSSIKIVVQESSSELSLQKPAADILPDLRINVKAEKMSEDQAKSDIKEEPKADLDEKEKLDYLMEKMQEYGIEKMMSMLKKEA